jgi:processive 1,2-diacylglycerol beta-glucosyltransferase
MSATGTEDGPRVLVLSADVGEGHLAAARALADGLRACSVAIVVERDGLVAFGRVLRHVIRDGYRWQLRWAPWSYGAMYWLGTRVPPARAVGTRVLSAAAQRRLRAIVRRERPDVVVSTHPALTCVLGRMRLRRRLDVPVCATITDLADYAFWSHPGADLHLVMHEAAVAPVERVAGAGSAAIVRPLVAARFLGDIDAGAARARLGLAIAGRVVLVSGGGWGVGDLGGAVDAALAFDEATVVVVTGHNDTVRVALADRFAAASRVRVLGFTDQMDDLLRAADVAIHSTGGVTSFEALACGCPLIAYGSSLGHIAVHNRTMAELGLLTVAESREELAATLRSHLVDPPPRPVAVARATGEPARAVIEIRARVQPLPRWRLAAGRAIAPMACVAVVLASLSTDEAYSLAARPLELRPITHVVTAEQAVGVVVRAPNGAELSVARALAARRLHASFAVRALLPTATEVAIARLGDDTLPELTGSGNVRWLRVRAQLRGAGPLGADRRYLVPPDGLTLGQYLVGRTVDASPVAGRLTVIASHPTSARPSSGDIVVVTADGAARDTVSAVAALGTGAMRTVPLSTLLGSSTSERTAGAVVRTTAPPSTTARPARIPAGPRGA